MSFSDIVAHCNATFIPSFKAEVYRELKPGDEMSVPALARKLGIDPDDLVNVKSFRSGLEQLEWHGEVELSCGRISRTKIINFLQTPC